MAFIVKKNINGREYFYLNENKRVGGKVKTKTLAYLGKTKRGAEEKMKKILEDKKEPKLEFVEAKNQAPTKISMEDLAIFCKRRGFVFQSSEIYGGFSGFWDFGPLGVELFNNIKKEWWNFFVHRKRNMTGIEASIISHPRTWKASGHISNFSDVAVVCKKCKKSTKIDKSEVGKIKCDCGGDYENLGEFNLLFKTKVGALNSDDTYLRGETAQGMFMDFKLVSQNSRMQLPFGIAQIGKCFRNEIAPRDFLFRSREFNIGEFEFFINPEEKKCEFLDEKHLNVSLKLLDSETQSKGKKDLKNATIREMVKGGNLDEWHAYWLAEQILWFKSLNLDEIKIREHARDELSHYSSATFDIDYEYPFGSREIAGNANRGQYDLTQHQNESKESMEIFDEKTKTKVIPRVIEPTFGMERVFLAVLVNGYNYDQKRENVVLKISPKIAPIKAAIFPIVKKDEFKKLSLEIFDDLSKEWNVNYDESGSIGRRYSRNDEIGTPYCITVDEESLKNGDVTIRDRDTTRQVRVKVSQIKEKLGGLIGGELEFEKLVA